MLTRGRKLGLLALLGALVLAGLLAREEIARVDSRQGVASPEPSRVVASARESSAAPTPRAIRVKRKRLIERIRNEPERPCRSEDVLVEVDLVEGHKAAKVFISGEAGRKASLIFPEAGPQTVSILARDWEDGIQIHKHPIHVRDCDPPERLRIRKEQLAADPDSVFFRVENAGEETGGYHWDFGDGSKGYSSTNLIEHSYRLRKQDEATSAFLIRADSEDYTMSGRTTLSLVNPLFIASQGNTLWLAVEADTTPTRGASGEALQIAATVLNGSEERIDLVGATLRGFACRDMAAVETISLDRSGLSTTTLPPGAETALTLQVDPETFQEPACRAEVRLRGHTARGRTVESIFGIELGTPADAPPVRDYALLRQLHCARRILDEKRITPQDLARLEASGAFAEAGCLP